MDCIWIARWPKGQTDPDTALRAAEAVRDHWKELALDQGFDPDKNICLAQSDTMVAVGLSPEMDAEFREGPGEWRFY